MISDRHNQVEVRLAGANGKNTWSGVINIAGGPIAGRVTPTNFHLGPNENSDFQDIGPNQDAPKMLGVLLWDSAGKPKNGVAISPANRARFPKYDHLLVEVKNRDNMSNATSGNRRHYLVDPAWCRGSEGLNALGADGKPVLSGEVLRSAKFSRGARRWPTKPWATANRLPLRRQLGQYQLKIEMIGGNSIQYSRGSRYHRGTANE